MQTLARPLPSTAARPTPDDQAALTAAGHGAWRIARDRIEPVEPFYVGSETATVLVPTEQVLLSTVALPLPNHAKRLAALPFAIEDRIAEPIETVHVALGNKMAGQDWLAGVVRHEVMRGWLAQIAAAGLGDAALVPDALTLPVPEAGHWSVAAEAGRALVRTPDGAGFAVPLAGLAAAWAAAGTPGIHAYGAALPETFGATAATRAPVAPALNLRQGAYAAANAGLPRWAKRLAIIVGIALAAHLAIAIVDLIALKTMAGKRKAETIALIQQKAPGTMIGDDVVAQATALVPSSVGKAPGRALPLLVRLSQAIAPVAGSLKVEAMTLDEAAGTVTLTVSVPDPGKMQALNAAITGAGLTITPGAVGPQGATVTVSEGAAR
jgi:general secretion pathway protein L